MRFAPPARRPSGRRCGARVSDAAQCTVHGRGRAAGRRAGAALAELELDLEVFSGPFDLLLTLVLREEVDLLEVELADVVLTYLDFLEARGELDLEAATEFLVLIAALLELKSRLMLPREDEELLTSSPARRPRSCSRGCSRPTATAAAAEHLSARLAAEHGRRFRSAPLPRSCASADPERVRGVVRPGAARGGDRRDAAHAAGDQPAPPHDPARDRGRAPRATCAGCCAAAALRFDEAVEGADRVTVAVTLFALLELYKQGEADWDQDEPFGEITVAPRGAAGADEDVGMSELARDRSRRCCSSRPSP